MKTTDPIKLLQEIEAWFCFNYNPDKNSIYKLRQDIKYCLSNIDQQHPSREKVIDAFNAGASIHPESHKLEGENGFVTKKLNKYLSELSEGEEEAGLLLDGSKMPAKEFYAKYDEYVGMPHKEWEELPTTKKEGTGETYEYRDSNFAMGGSAYSEPKLYRLTEGEEESGVMFIDKDGFHEIEQAKPEQEPHKLDENWNM